MRYAFCNEMFGEMPFHEVCAIAAALGYSGIEVAPFTQAPLITQVTAAQRAELRQQAADAGLAIIGLHWLFANTGVPDGHFHLISPDAAVRQRTGEYLARLADAAADLAPQSASATSGGTEDAFADAFAPLLVLGSPQQRQRPGGGNPTMTPDQAADLAADTIAVALDTLSARGVTLCLEPLGPEETNFLNTAQEAADLMRRIGHENVKVHLDVKAMCTEADPIPQIIQDHAAHTGHFHANDANRRGPGTGKTDFMSVFRALHETGYAGWVSVEAFDLTPDPLTVVRDGIAVMKRCEAEAIHL